MVVIWFFRTRWSSVLGALACAAVALAAPSAPRAQVLDYRDAASAPPSWVQFAKLVKYRFDTWLTADEPVANHFRAYVTEHAGKDGGPPASLVVRAWVNPDGSIQRVSFDPLRDPVATEDLRLILMHGNVGEAPPPEMLQPLSLRFSLNLKK